MDWLLLEASGRSGGLADSFVDKSGFTRDIGGHAQFSHYDYFDVLMDELLGKEGWIEHARGSWVWLRDRFVPYPLQNNIHRPSEGDCEKCLQGFATASEICNGKPPNFREWTLATFGQEFAELFMFPYNFKVWAFSPEGMDAAWVGKRVATPDVSRLRANLAADTDDISWGPNHEATPVSRAKRAQTHVLKHRGDRAGGDLPDVLRAKCWMYVPEDNCPFYRVAVFSSPPASSRHWLLMAEVSESP